MTNREWAHRILDFKTAVSDTVNFTCGSASLSCFDPARGKIYTVYHASRTKYGEARDVFVLAIIPVCQPHRTENIVIVEHEVPIDGVIYTNIIDGNCIFLDGKVRIYFLSGGNRYFYVDFFPDTKTFSKILPVQCSFDGVTRELTDDAVAEYLNSRHLTGWAFHDPHEHIINTGKMYFHRGYWYGCMTSYWCQPVIYRSADGSCFEFVGHIEKVAQYETQTAIVEDTMYALLRGAEALRTAGIQYHKTPAAALYGKAPHRHLRKGDPAEPCPGWAEQYEAAHWPWRRPWQLQGALPDHRPLRHRLL